VSVAFNVKSCFYAAAAAAAATPVADSAAVLCSVCVCVCDTLHNNRTRLARRRKQQPRDFG